MRRSLEFHRSIQLCDYIHALVKAKLAAVEAEIVVPCIAEFHIGIETIVGLSSLILIFYAVFR